jgi:hypothetical protein
MEANYVRGIEGTHLDSEVARITSWREINPLELKLTILQQKALNENYKFDEDKEASCPLCFCPLFDGMDLKANLNTEI